MFEVSGREIQSSIIFSVPVLFFSICLLIRWFALRTTGSVSSVKSAGTLYPSHVGTRIAGSRPCTPGIGTYIRNLPYELTSEIARSFELSDIGSVAAVSRFMQCGFWDNSEVWHRLTVDFSLNLPPSLSDGKLAISPREAFRCALFRVDAQHLNCVGATACNHGNNGHIAVLLEAAHMVRGLMPVDGKTVMQDLSNIVEKSLLAHNPTNKAAAAAAVGFLEIAQRRVDLFSRCQLDRFENVYGGALQLEELLEYSSLDILHQIELSMGSATTDTQFDCEATYIECSSDAHVEEMHEQQRVDALDEMLEAVINECGGLEP